MKFIITAIVFGVMPVMAFAGNVQCRFGDANGDFLFGASFNDDGTSGLLDIKGNLTSPSIRTKAGSPLLEIRSQHVAEEKFDADGAYLRLEFPAVGAVTSKVGVKISARRMPSDGIAYAGNYLLSITPAVEADNVAYSGAATCSIQ